MGTGTFPRVQLEGLAFGGALSAVGGGFGDQSGHFLDATVCVFGGGGVTSWQIGLD